MIMWRRHNFGGVGLLWIRSYDGGTAAADREADDTTWASPDWNRGDIMIESAKQKIPVNRNLMTMSPIKTRYHFADANKMVRTESEIIIKLCCNTASSFRFFSCFEFFRDLNFPCF